MTTRITAAHETDIPSLLSLNNRYAGSGLTLARTPDFAANHLGDYRVLRDANGGVLGCVALDEYSPSVAELISLAVAAEAHGLGHGRALIDAAVALATRRGYATLFAVSYSDDLFLHCGFDRVPLSTYPEKIARYQQVDRTEIEVGEKHCFARPLAP
ncbi:MAG: GNAT family N-acetyltransferase [Gemmatimonadota bacterium]|jgi:amino-acid N-acetyltransferase|nr:GNAT family N-acetyltransferase [Gemmatimonadota bacterium]MDQ8149426.1 GNAT family N-acetyltransferase [Gemmatimonadota bacterium]MDQ8157760.1 GNAT family N-acetyltransferase [Gemmatimonadota bacterium]MDQ8176895.1 GNAT family N-acetyltransferase [Gemmatimonadota bacterium]